MEQFRIQAIDFAGILNLKGWRIIRLSDSAVLNGFTTRREAERLVEFFTGGRKDE